MEEVSSDLLIRCTHTVTSCNEMAEHSDESHCILESVSCICHSSLESLPGAILVLSIPLSISAQSKPAPPNIVFIFSDDHAYQAISAYGHPSKLLNTPNIDRIAEGGMRFDRCVVPNSLCGPRRACVLTGKYNHINGFYNNTNSRFDGSQFTFPKALARTRATRPR